jgi:thymidylate kinase
MFSILRDAKYARIICDRTHLGEVVYAPIYRGYSGDFIFNLEEQFNVTGITGVRLILLTEDFSMARHFVDDGKSFDNSNRADEQDMFIRAFNESTVDDKRIICVTNPETGEFKDRELILKEALA